MRPEDRTLISTVHGKNLLTICTNGWQIEVDARSGRLNVGIYNVREEPTSAGVVAQAYDAELSLEEMSKQLTLTGRERA